jgi:hypothetical protein
MLGSLHRPSLRGRAYEGEHQLNCLVGPAPSADERPPRAELERVTDRRPWGQVLGTGDVTPTIGSHALLLQLTTNLVQNAIVHNLPEQGTVWVTTGVQPKSVVLVENTRREAHPTVGFYACGAVSSRHPTHTHRPRRCRCRPRPGNRQKHHPSTRWNPHPHPPGRWRAPRHGATTRRTTAPTRRLPASERFGDRSWGQIPGSSGPPRASRGRGRQEPRRRIDPRKTRRGAGLLEPAAEDEILHGKEGVDGSSPSEGFEKPLQIGGSSLMVLSM